MEAKEAKYNWNSNEKRLLETLKRARGPLHLSELAKRAFGPRRLKKEKANSWARNSLRRPVKFRLVKQVERGTYEFIGTKGKPTKRKAKAATAMKRPKKATKPVKSQQSKQAPEQATPAAEQKPLVTV